MKKKDRKLTKRQYAKAIARVCKVAYKAAPGAVVLQLVGSLITSILPIVTTYFAALTTTALAEAYAGDTLAGERAILFVIITALLGIVVMVWQSFESYLSKLMSFKIESAVSDQMYERFSSLEYWRYDDKKTVDLYERAQRFANFFPYIFNQFASIMTSFITMIAGLVALILVSWWLGLIVVVAIIPGIVIQLKLSRQQAKHWNENVENRRSQHMIEWNLLQPSFMAELRLYAVTRYLLDLRMKLRNSDELTRIRFERSYIKKRLASDVLQAGAEVTALVWVTLQIINRNQPIGQFLYVQQIVSRSLGGAERFVSIISDIDEDLANLFDYEEFMSLPIQQKELPKLLESPERIELRGISFHYPHSKKRVLQDINLTITKGQHIAIVGENGAGKSTLIKLITGLYEPTDGTVMVDDESLQTKEMASWHRLLSVLQQDYLAYSFANAKDNVYFGDVTAPFDQGRFDRAVDKAEARTFLEALPSGVNSYVSQWMEDSEGNNGTDLSGGQWQRLALARNFYRDAPIIILDEPTSAIDALAEARIFNHLFADKKRTIITISHRLTTIERADMIYMLQDGKLVEQGTHAELVKKKGHYYTMFESQIRK